MNTAIAAAEDAALMAAAMRAAVRAPAGWPTSPAASRRSSTLTQQPPAGVVR